MDREGYPKQARASALGVDLGATLAKLAFAGPAGETCLELLPATALDALRTRIETLRPERVALTGAGAPELARSLPEPPFTVDEFTAWRAGAETLLEEQRAAGAGPYLLVSLGTGTSVLRVEGEKVERVGGTALGGGTLLGLGAALLGTRSFEELAALASRGRRERIDLRVGDIDRFGVLPLAAAMTASNFGKAAPRLESGQALDREDVAHALFGLVAENVALICAGVARQAGLRRVVLAGSTLRENRSLEEICDAVLRALGCEPLFLRTGEFAGSLGALLLAQR